MQVVLLFIMTEWKFLYNPDDRIDLWRNTIQLFHMSRKVGFVGPFKAAGFNYVIEKMSVSSNGINYPKPDILASSNDGFVVLELTTNNSKSKFHVLNDYTSISPQHLHNHGLKNHSNKQPDVISSRLHYLDDGNYCQLIVEKNLEIKKMQYIQNKELLNALKNSEGVDLSKVPSIPFTIVPEMHKNSPELRRGLIEIIMQIFKPNSKGKTAADMVKEGMERLYPKVDSVIVNQLNQKVTQEMDGLVKDQLKEYLTKKDGKYVASEKFKPHFRTLEAINNKLKNWAGLSTQSTLYDFK